MDDETTEKKRRTRKPKMQFPVEASLWIQGLREPRRISALWIRKEVGCIVFGLPEFERPYMQRTLRVPDTAGVVIELVELAQQQRPELPMGGTMHLTEGMQHNGVSLGIIPTSGQTAESSVTAAFGNRPLRSRVAEGLPPVSEAVDEAGNPIIVKAAFGLMPSM